MTKIISEQMEFVRMKRTTLLKGHIMKIISHNGGDRFCYFLFCQYKRQRAMPDAITKEFFAFVTYAHRADQGTAWPSVGFGSWRLWDAYVTWARYCSPPEVNGISPGWTAILRWLKSTISKFSLPLANTPGWAAARPNEASSS